jgi:hypothetical protein
MAFKSEIHVAELASIRIGHTEGDIYYILDNGMLGDLPCKPGNFVKWHNNAWQIQPDEHYALASAVDDEIAQVISDTKTLVKDEAIGVEWAGNPAMVGDVVMHDGLRYVCTTNNMDEEWDPSHWTLLSVGTDIERLQRAIGSVKNGGVLTDAASVNVPNNALSTLATAQATLTLNVNVGTDDVPNFAVEVTPSADCTLTVTKTVGNTTTTLNPSVAGGNSLTTGKKYQLTCVGSCWTLAEFAMPNP